MRFAYLGALLLSLGGLALLDRRFRLAFWHDARRAALTVGIGVLAFLLWDVAGLVLGIFARGDSPHMTGLLLAPELPVEEAFFLALLCYTALLAWRWFDRTASLRDAGVRARAGGSGGADGPGTGGRGGPA
ncbi:lycopene cyclase domain-containing protein [Cellulomonas fimi]|uniref:Lycopene cyclase domain protein n=1 Tax=Cellulomonas fimi (strain ATCC 484 / DSM 20113 / JCM 1341 / CCUG 24087 / LMG 16345 / NBRC 15513 / NCIMB 8980 / NCTC 7547 / NRS-133) TaxID=590998 RepID=F4GZW6_CELFA|nr:lycopene cyclase domain-containing protein [Cellulomonas fimi]AEE47282.1 lycopene cyclase domain protein [Cellulomonas fimi ATCC 484]NNH06996.1 lycopene cyclase domain-containing protein [Cellulomonas fimi]VEH35799.1 lycopene cyclase domain [Cellulomonas fimi]